MNAKSQGDESKIKQNFPDIYQDRDKYLTAFRKFDISNSGTLDSVGVFNAIRASGHKSVTKKQVEKSTPVPIYSYLPFTFVRLLTVSISTQFYRCMMQIKALHSTFTSIFGFATR